MEAMAVVALFAGILQLWFCHICLKFYFPPYLVASQGLRIISKPGLTPVLKVIKSSLLGREKLS